MRLRNQLPQRSSKTAQRQTYVGPPPFRLISGCAGHIITYHRSVYNSLTSITVAVVGLHIAQRQQPLLRLAIPLALALEYTRLMRLHAKQDWGRELRYR